MHGREVTVPWLKTMAKWHLWQLWELIEGGNRKTSSFWMVMYQGIKVWHKLVKSLSDLVFVVKIDGFESAVASFRKTKTSPPEGKYLKPDVRNLHGDISAKLGRCLLSPARSLCLFPAAIFTMYSLLWHGLISAKKGDPCFILAPVCQGWFVLLARGGSYHAALKSRRRSAHQIYLCGKHFVPIRSWQLYFTYVQVYNVYQHEHVFMCS